MTKLSPRPCVKQNVLNTPTHTFTHIHTLKHPSKHTVTVWTQDSCTFAAAVDHTHLATHTQTQCLSSAYVSAVPLSYIGIT